MRGKLGKLAAELEVQRYAGLRVLSALNKGDAPGAASSITKLSYTEFEKRYYETALEILGPWGQMMTARGGVRGDRHGLGRGGHLGHGISVGAGRHHLLGLVGDPEEHHR